MSSIETRAHYETVGSKPASTTLTSVLTCPTAGGLWYVILNASICASDGNAGTADVFRTDTSAATTYTIVNDGVVPAAGNYAIPGVEGLVLEAGDILKVTPSRADQHVIVNYMVGRPEQPLRSENPR